MHTLGLREEEIIKSIHKNHEHLLETQMATHFGVHFEMDAHREKLYSWLESLNEVRLLSKNYLDTIVKNPIENPKPQESEPSTISYISSKIKSFLPLGVSEIFTASASLFSGYSLLSMVGTELFSLTLGHSITGVLYEYFTKEFQGASEDAQKQFHELIEKQTQLSALIKKDCEQISIQLIQLFHFREMLLLGKVSSMAIEPNARNEFIKRANLTKESSEVINKAIEIYFAKELSIIFNTGFQSIYQVHELEIKAEKQAPFLSWIQSFSQSEKLRLSFTQEIQLKFIQLARDFLLEQKNEPGILAKNPIFFSLVTGFTFSLLLGGALALALSGGLAWGIVAIALTGFALVGVATYFTLKKVDYFHYMRNPGNRNQIQEAVDLINTEYLRLEKEMIEKKQNTSESLENTKNFKEINQNFIHSLGRKKIARGSVSGWLREYAARYRHSLAVEIDLSRDYQQLIIQSKNQSHELIKSINKKEKELITEWIKDTQSYLINSEHTTIIKDFELIQKIKEQILEIVPKLDYIPPNLLLFYCAPLNTGGLAGNESDFDHIKRFSPNSKTPNPYDFLCETALNLYKNHELDFNSGLIFLGCSQYRSMLGLPNGRTENPITPENIDKYLDNSYTFLLSLCKKINPGRGLDPLSQAAQVRDEFILYRMLLLKQLAALADTKNKRTNSEVKLKISHFVQRHFNPDPKSVFDNLSNQIFLLNKEVHTALSYKNSEEVELNDAELNNLYHAITLDMTYNSQRFTLNDILKYCIEEYKLKNSINTIHLFANGNSETELNPQSSKQYIDTLSKYCDESAAFIRTAKMNQALSTTHILECYQFNVSQQIYRTMLRIIKNISQLKVKPEHIQHIDLLHQALKRLHEFAQIHCLALSKDSPCGALFNNVLSKPSSTDSYKDWIKKIDAKDINKLIETIQESIALPEMKIDKPNNTPIEEFRPKHSKTKNKYSFLEFPGSMIPTYPKPKSKSTSNFFRLSATQTSLKQDSKNKEEICSHEHSH